MESFITPQYAANTLGVCRKRIYQMIAEGKLPAMRMGTKQWRISKTGLEAFVQRQLETTRRELGHDLPAPPLRRHG